MTDLTPSGDVPIRVCSECLEPLHWDGQEDAYVDAVGSTGCADRVDPENGPWPHEIVEFDTMADADDHVRIASERRGGGS